jgi:hypothetical protein
MKKKVILTTYSPLLYTQNMSEPEERPYGGVQEEQNEEVIQEGAEARVEERGKGVEAIRSTAEEEEQETIAKKKIRKQEEKEKVKKPKKKKAPKSKRKEGKFDIAGISKQIEKQSNYLARLEQVLQPLRKLAKDLDVQSKVVKEINTSVRQLQRQLMQIQKAIQKGKIRRK